MTTFTALLSVNLAYSVDWQPIGQVINGERVYSRYGDSVALNADGTVMAIGAGGDEGLDGSTPGTTKVYRLASGFWEPIGSFIVKSSSRSFGRPEALNTLFNRSRKLLELVSRLGHRKTNWSQHAYRAQIALTSGIGGLTVKTIDHYS